MSSSFQSPIGTKQNNEFISAVGHESTAYQSPIGTQKTHNEKTMKYPKTLRRQGF